MQTEFTPHFIEAYSNNMITITVDSIINFKELKCKLEAITDSSNSESESNIIIQGEYINAIHYGCVPKTHYGYYELYFSQNVYDYVRSKLYLSEHLHIIKNIKSNDFIDRRYYKIKINIWSFKKMISWIRW